MKFVLTRPNEFRVWEFMELLEVVKDDEEENVILCVVGAYKAKDGKLTVLPL